MTLQESIQAASELIKSGKQDEWMPRLNALRQELQDNAEAQYRLGNLYFEAAMPEQARGCWSQAATLKQQPTSVTAQAIPRFSLKRLIWQASITTIVFILSLYIFIVLSFPRQQNLMDLLMAMGNSNQQQQQQPSWWEEFWNTNRPNFQRQPFLDAEDIWMDLRQEIHRWFKQGEADRREGLTQEEQLLEWLDKLRSNPRSFSVSTPAGQKHAVAKGYYQIREFEKAIELVDEALAEKIDAAQTGRLLQEKATIYYFQGYQLQPDGLAKYDLEMVRKSVESYEQARQYIQDPYLYGNLSWGYYLLEEYDQAIEHGMTALRLDNSLSYVRMNLGITYIRQKRHELAYQVYREVMLSSPAYRDFEGGLRDLRELVREYPEQYPFTWFVFGLIDYHLGNFKQAEQHFETFLAKPFSQPAWKNKANYYIRNMKAGKITP